MLFPVKLILGDSTFIILWEVIQVRYPTERGDLVPKSKRPRIVKARVRQKEDVVPKTKQRWIIYIMCLRHSDIFQKIKNLLHI